MKRNKKDSPPDARRDPLLRSLADAIVEVLTDDGVIRFRSAGLVIDVKPITEITWLWLHDAVERGRLDEWLARWLNDRDETHGRLWNVDETGLRSEDVPADPNERWTVTDSEVRAAASAVRAQLERESE